LTDFHGLKTEMALKLRFKSVSSVFYLFSVRRFGKAQWLLCQTSPSPQNLWREKHNHKPLNPYWNYWFGKAQSAQHWVKSFTKPAPFAVISYSVK
jgi:hypothetical protein